MGGWDFPRVKHSPVLSGVGHDCRSSGEEGIACPHVCCCMVLLLVVPLHWVHTRPFSWVPVHCNAGSPHANAGSSHANVEPIPLPWGPHVIAMLAPPMPMWSPSHYHGATLHCNAAHTLGCWRGGEEGGGGGDCLPPCLVLLVLLLVGPPPLTPPMCWHSHVACRACQLLH